MENKLYVSIWWLFSITLKIQCLEFEIIEDIDDTKCETTTPEVFVNSTTECVLNCQGLKTDNAILKSNGSCSCTSTDCSRDKKEGSSTTFYKGKDLKK